MASLLLTTKLHVPQVRSERVLRPRLVARLERGLDKRLTLVSAPAGYGKTTLLCQWLATCNIPAAWVSLDITDSDPTRFWNYIITAVQSTFSSVGKTLSEALLQYNQPISEALLTELINELDKLDQPLIMVLDDYHNIETQIIHDGLSYLLEHAPTHFHLVLTTRVDPPLLLARLRARSQMIELRSADLRFTTQEMTEFLRTVMSLDLSDSDLSVLENSTEGWIAGLQMVGLSLQGRENASAFIKSFSGEDRHILDFLFAEVFQHQPEEIQSFLLQSSILERFCASLCNAVTLRKDSRFTLDTLERNNLFLIGLDEQGKWYRYHHLFSDLLRLMLDKTHPGLSVELHRRACLWHEAQGLLPEALDHALSSGDLRLVAQIISVNALVLEENDALLPTLGKIDALPLEKVTALPWLGIARAWIFGSGQIQKAEQILNAVEKSMDTVSDGIEPQRFNGHIAALRANLLFNKGDFANAITSAKLATEMLPVDEVAVRVRSLSTWGNALIGLQNMIDALGILEGALFVALQTERPHIIMNATSALGNAYLIAGRMHDAERICRDALKIAEDYQQATQCPLLATSEIYSLLSRVLGEWGEVENAIQFAQYGVNLSHRWGQDLSESYCLCFLARALIFGNDLAGARRAFQRADRLTWKISKWAWQDRAMFTLGSWLDSESIEPAEISQLVNRIEESGVCLPTFLRTRLQMRTRKLDELLVELDRAFLELKGQPSYHTVRFHALGALALQAKGDEKQALVELRKALELGESENRVATFVCEGAAMETLLRVALTKKICPEFVQRLLGAFAVRRKAAQGTDSEHTLSKDTRPKAENLIEPLTEREMEILRLLNSHLPTPDIADVLALSVNTVRTHIKSIYAKLGVHSRTAAIDVSKKLKLLA